jgi:hypothetical protein
VAKIKVGYMETIAAYLTPNIFQVAPISNNAVDRVMIEIVEEEWAEK